MLVHLIRHGAYPMLDRALGGRAPHSLSPEGHAQAQRLADHLAPRPIAAVVSSPVQRAQETAAPIAAILNLELRTDAAFTEIDCAAWTNRGFDELRDDPAWDAWNRFRSMARVPGGETILQVQSRAIAGLWDVAARYPDQEVAIVSHADVIKVALSYCLGAPLDLMHRLEIAPASISQVQLYPGDAKVLCINRLA